MSPPRLSLDEAKRTARAQALFLREACDPAQRAAHGEALARHVLVLHHGEAIAHGEPAAVVRDPAVVKSYLGTEAVG